MIRVQFPVTPARLTAGVDLGCFWLGYGRLPRPTRMRYSVSAAPASLDQNTRRRQLFMGHSKAEPRLETSITVEVGGDQIELAVTVRHGAALSSG